MVLFVSQAPVLVVLIPVLLLIALFEMIGLKERRNILALAALAALALVCLVAAMPVSANQPALASLLYATGATLAIVLSLYAIMTARRGKQRTRFAGLLAAAAMLVVATAARLTLGAQNADATTFALTFVPAIGALLYGVFAPDIPKPRGGMV